MTCGDVTLFPLDVECSSCGSIVAIADAFASHKDGDRVWTCEDCLERCPDRPGWRRDRNGREWYSARWLSTLAVFAAVTLAAGVAFLAPARASAASSTLPARVVELATRVAGAPFDVHCLTFGESLAAPSDPTAVAGVTTHDAAGLTYRRADGSAYVVLATYVCNGLRVNVAAKHVAAYELALYGQALLVLLHESEHVSGLVDETVAECAAIAALPTAIRSLVPLRRRATVTAWARRADASLPAAYHTASC